MNIKINSLTDVTVDGTQFGGVVDVLGNLGNDALRAPMLDALMEREKEIAAAFTTDKDGALESQRQASDKDREAANDEYEARLEELRAELLEKHGVEIQGLHHEIEMKAGAIKSLNDLCEKIGEERDDLAGQLKALESRQDGLAKAAQSFVAALKAVTDQGEALSVEAGKSLKDKADEAKAKQLAEAEEVVRRLKGE